MPQFLFLNNGILQDAPIGELWKLKLNTGKVLRCVILSPKIPYEISEQIGGEGEGSHCPAHSSFFQGV